MAKPTPENLAKAFELAHQYLPGIQGLLSAAFFGFSPLQSSSEDPDLDMILIRSAEQMGEELELCLQRISTESNLPLDVWLLEADDLLERMQIVASEHPQPEPQSEMGEWKGLEFISIFGIELLSSIVKQANQNPVNKPKIKPTEKSKLFFRP